MALVYISPLSLHQDIGYHFISLEIFDSYASFLVHILIEVVVDINMICLFIDVASKAHCYFYHTLVIHIMELLLISCRDISACV
jgi:hypothetical protein